MYNANNGAYIEGLSLTNQFIVKRFHVQVCTIKHGNLQQLESGMSTDEFHKLALIKQPDT